MIHIIRFTVMILIMRIEANRDKKGKRKKIVIKKKEARRCFGCRSSSTRRRNGCAVFPCVPVINDGGGGAPPPPPPPPGKTKKKAKGLHLAGQKGQKNAPDGTISTSNFRTCVCVCVETSRLSSKSLRPHFKNAPSFSGLHWDSIGLDRFELFDINFTRFYLVLLGFTGFYWVLLSPTVF